MRKICLKIAGVLNLITALTHLVAGQMDLVNPLSNSSLNVQQKAEWIGVWHVVTIFLLFTSYLFIRAGFFEVNTSNAQPLKPFAALYILMGLPFIVSSIYFSVLAPQWILLMPIGVLLIIGLRKLEKNAK